MQATALERTKTRILLIENDAWDASLVQEALGELEERPQDSLLPLPLDLFHAESVDEALAAMRGQKSELILLDLAAHAQGGLHGFLQTRQAMPETPIVILTRQQDEALALAAMREGAAGYVLKEDLDCLPLARQLRAALDHHQALAASQHAAAVDELTCLTSRAAFLRMAELVRGLAAKWGRSVALVRVELESLRTDAAPIPLLQTADMLRDIFAGAELVARTGEMEFALLLVESAVTESTAEEMMEDWIGARRDNLVMRSTEGYRIEIQNPLLAGQDLENLLRKPAAAREAVAK